MEWREFGAAYLPSIRMNYLQLFSCCLRAVLLNRATLVAENLALRQQLAILQRARPRPRLRNRDRLFWVVP